MPAPGPDYEPGGFQRGDDVLQHEIDDLLAEQLELEIELDAQAGVQQRQGVAQASQVEAAKSMDVWSIWFMVGLAIACLLIGGCVGFLISVLTAQSTCGSAWAIGLPC